MERPSKISTTSGWTGRYRIWMFRTAWSGVVYGRCRSSSTARRASASSARRMADGRYGHLAARNTDHGHESDGLSGAFFAVLQPNRTQGVAGRYRLETAEENARNGMPWFNTGAFTVTPSYTIGNAARNYTDLRRDNYRNMNVSLARNFSCARAVQAAVARRVHQRVQPGGLRNSRSRCNHAFHIRAHYDTRQHARIRAARIANYVLRTIGRE